MRPNRIPPTVMILLLAAAGPLAGQTVRARVCLPESEGMQVAIEGMVVDSASGIPLADAQVRVAWQSTAGGRVQRAQAATDAGGRFSFCALDGARPLNIDAHYAGAASGALPVDPSVTRIERRISLTAPRTRLSGRVLDHATDQPLADATVTLAGAAFVGLTGADGRFAFPSVPVGRHSFGVERPGFQYRLDSVHLDATVTTDVTVRMTAGVVALPPLTVRARSRLLDRVGFFERQQRGAGIHLTRAEIEAKRPLSGADVVRGLAGMRVVSARTGGRYLTAGRGSCRFRYVIDGVRLGREFELDDVAPHWIEGIEIYHGPSAVPTQFATGSTTAVANCGVIVIWTREGR